MKTAKEEIDKRSRYKFSHKKYLLITQAVQTLFNEYEGNLTLRQIYYRLVSNQMIKNSRGAYTELGRLLVLARETGDIDYNRIEDRTRRIEGGDGVFTNPEEYLDAIISKLGELASTDSYQGNRSHWQNQNNYVEVWVEKDALAGVLEPVTDRYKVPLAVCRGYSSFSFIMEGVKRLREASEGGRVLKVLYLGDFDPSGEDMSRDLLSRLDNYSPLNIALTKIAITPDQINEYNLPPSLAKESDVRSTEFIKKHGALSAVELDALPPNVLKQILISAIEREIDAEKWNSMNKSMTREAAALQEKYKQINAAINHARHKVDNP